VSRADRTYAADLAGAVSELLGVPCRTVSERPHRSATTAELHEIDVVAGDGRQVRLMAKDLGRDGPASARRIGPSFMFDPEREPWVYRELLAPRHLGAPYVGRWSPPGGDWLILGRVEGMQLRYTDDPAAWRAAGGWLGRFHGANLAAAMRCSTGSGPAPLPVADAGWHARWWVRARSFHPDARAVLDEAAAISARHPVRTGTVIHGDFHATNVLATSGRHGSAPTVTALDWETAALGDRWHDVACLLAGDLPAALRDAVITGYVEAGGSWPEGAGVYLMVAELRAAVQWLGWADPQVWRPPAGQRQVWQRRLGELVARLR